MEELHILQALIDAYNDQYGTDYTITSVSDRT